MTRLYCTVLSPDFGSGSGEAQIHHQPPSLSSECFGELHFSKRLGPRARRVAWQLAIIATPVAESLGTSAHRACLEIKPLFQKTDIHGRISLSLGNNSHIVIPRTTGASPAQNHPAQPKHPSSKTLLHATQNLSQTCLVSSQTRRSDMSPSTRVLRNRTISIPSLTLSHIPVHPNIPAKCVADLDGWKLAKNWHHRPRGT